MRLRLRTMLVLVVISALGLSLVNARRRSRLVREIGPQDGPYVVMAQRFRGPEAESHARTLAAELRDEHGLKTYLFRTAMSPHRRAILRNSHDETMVMVGDAATLQECRSILSRIKAIAPRCFAGSPAVNPRLRSAHMTMNPLAPETTGLH
jgi:hypothetical protein